MVRIIPRPEALTSTPNAYAGEVLTASFWNTNVRDNTDAIYQSIKRIAYISRTTTYNVNQTALASAADVFSSDLTFTADGTSAYRIEFYCAHVRTGTATSAATYVYLVDGSGNSLGILGDTQNNGASNSIQAPMFAAYYLTPSAGSVSLNVRAIYAAATGSLEFGVGGSGTNRIPGYFAVFGPSLT
jgi:hypothetical protein